MTGNDIVDITTAAIESNWKRKGYLQKIYTDQELQYIQNAAAADYMVWRLWSMKESAYKLYSRQMDVRFFAPRNLSCTLINETSGWVKINHIIYYTQTCSSQHYVYTTARPDETCSSFFYNCVFSLPLQMSIDHQQFIYNKLITHFASETHTRATNVMVIKEKNNIPYLYCKKENIKIPVSITHHGNYAAFTIQ